MTISAINNDKCWYYPIIRLTTILDTVNSVTLTYQDITRIRLILIRGNFFRVINRHSMMKNLGFYTREKLMQIPV